MAKALKCDRCGGYFVPEELGDAMFCCFNNPVFQNGPDAIAERVTQRLIEGYDCNTRVDLCPNCTTEFFIFMNTSPRDKNIEGNG